MQQQIFDGAENQSDQPAWSVGARRAAAACFLGTMFGVAPIYVGTFSLFLEPVSLATGSGRGPLSVAFGLSGVLAALSSPIAGALIDRIGPYRAVALGTPVFGGGVGLLSIVPADPILIGLCYVLLAVAGGLGGVLAFFKIIAGWCPKNRGLIMGVVLGLGTGLGMALCVPIASYMIEAAGWRAGYLALSAIILFLLWPALLLLLPRVTPVEIEEELAPDGEVEETGTPPSIWLIVGAIFLATLATSGLSAHAAALFGDGGATAGQAATALVIIAVATAGGQILAGTVMDRARSAAGAIPFLLAAILGFAILRLVGVHNPALLYTAAVFIGLGSNLAFSAAPVMISRYFGSAQFGKYQGLVMGAAALSLGFGPALLGLSYDYWRSYDIPLTIMTLCLVVSAMGFWSLPRFSPPTAKAPDQWF